MISVVQANNNNYYSSKVILGAGVTLAVLKPVVRTSLLFNPKMAKTIRCGLLSTAVGILGYGIYKFIKKKPKYRPIDRDYTTPALVGASVAIVRSPIKQLVTSLLCASKLSKNMNNFFKIFKSCFSQGKFYLLADYATLLYKFHIPIKNLSKNKLIASGLVLNSVIGAVTGLAIHGLCNLDTKINNNRIK